jgi:tripartite-type tricarboxylate transporter receptor subunit TctC
MKKIESITHILLAITALIAFCSLSSAQTYPNKPIRMIVPNPIGGAAEFIIRPIAEKMTEKLGQPVVLDFRPGAGLTIGTAIAAKSNPDGYTLLEGIISPLAINVTLYKLTYDPMKDFAPISLIARLPAVLVLHPSIPARNLKELIALAKKHPGEMTYGSAGIGTSGNLFGELFKIKAGVKILHVPYKGGGPAIIGLLSGETSMEISGTAGSMGHIKSGRLRAIAVTGAKRTPVLPDVPTMIESGIPVEGTAWYSVVAPAGTPTLIVNQLRDAVIYAVESPRVRQLLLDQGAVPETSTPEELRDLISSEIVKWAEVIRLSGIKSE